MSGVNQSYCLPFARSPLSFRFTAETPWATGDKTAAHAGVTMEEPQWKSLHPRNLRSRATETPIPSSRRKTLSILKCWTGPVGIMSSRTKKYNVQQKILQYIYKMKDKDSNRKCSTSTHVLYLMNIFLLKMCFISKCTRHQIWSICEVQFRLGLWGSSGRCLKENQTVSEVLPWDAYRKNNWSEVPPQGEPNGPWGPSSRCLHENQRVPPQDA